MECQTDSDGRPDLVWHSSICRQKMDFNICDDKIIFISKMQSESHLQPARYNPLPIFYLIWYVHIVSGQDQDL